MSAKVVAIAENSIAQEVGIETGDILLSINGNQIEDILDYQFYSQDDYLVLEIEKPRNEIWEIEIEKDFDEELGLFFDGVVFNGMKVCKNHCIFCFIDQLPKNMRNTLYIKDDDYRYSFLYGNFITLTNLKDKDWDKIISMRLSPIYVSVHCTDPDLRAKILNNPRAKNIKEDLARLKQAGIEVHTQIVLCPGVNDGQVLINSINDLANFYPSVRSVGIVPVGLTGHRAGLTELRVFTQNEAKQLIEMVGQMQESFRQKFNYGFVYLADEFFIKAKINFPEDEYYDDYAQIENGIGLARIFLDEFEDLKSSLPIEVSNREFFIITGISAIPVLKPITERLNYIKGLHVELIPVKNQYFGGNVSVTGLLTGKDIINTLGVKYKGKHVLLPEIVFKEGQLVFLDDLSLEDIARETGAIISTVDGSAKSLIRKILSQ